jgi:hypothetical protein
MFAFDELKLGPAAVTVLAFVLGVGFASVYQIFDIVDYLSVPVFMWSVLVGLAFAALAKVMAISVARLGSTLERGRATGIATGLVVMLAALMTLFTASQSLASRIMQVDYSKLDRQGYWKTVKQELEGVPGGTVLVGDWYELNEALYFQRVEGWRPDLIGEPLNNVLREEGAQLDRWLAEGRQVFLLGHYEPVLSRFDAEVRGPITFGSEVRGPLWQVSGRKAQVDTPQMAHEVNRRFGSSIVLVGYTLSPENEMQPGDVLKMSFFWQALERVYERYTVFTHVIDEQGEKVGQKDDEPQRGYRPTLLWQPGETVAASLEIPISSTASPGKYRIVVGLYNSVTQQRLEAHAADGASLGDYVTLAEIVVPAR